MNYGVRWDRKVGAWIVYSKETDKIIAKFDTCEAAKKRQHELINGHDFKLKRK